MTLAFAAGSPAIPARPPRGALRHIPGDDGWPLLGSTIPLLADPQGFVERHAAAFGPIYRSRAFGMRSVTLLGPEANEFVLLDGGRLLSSTHGWFLLSDLFPRGLMLLDFDEHRVHRRALAVAFKAGPMRSYLAQLDAGIAERVRDWRARPGTMAFYPAMKQLTLDLAKTSFLGSGSGDEAEGLQRAFVDMIAAVLTPLRRPLPGTAMRRGLNGRAHVVRYFGKQIAARREGGGDDLFSQLCRMRDEEGALLSDQAIIDHMSFLMMAAHDTLTSSLTALVWLLAANPNWQERLRGEVEALRLGPGEPLAFEQLDAMPLTEMAFKEAMRLYPPVPSIPRRALRAFEFAGMAIPAGTGININPLYTHRMPELWPEPERFDPLRFTDEASHGRHRYAWVPFSGGAHMCLGLHFAYMQAKCFVRHLLGTLAVKVEPGYAPHWQMWPIPKPRDGLRVELEPL